MVNVRSGGPAGCQPHASCRPSRAPAAPSGTMRPLSSATGDERGRGQDRAVVLGDPGECLEAGHAPVGQVDDGLVVHDDPVVVECRLQHPLPVRSLLDLTAEGGVEDLGAPPAERLGAVHGLVGLVEQDLRRPSSADRDRDADARGDRVTVLDPIRAAAQLGDDAGADVDRVQVALDVGSEDDELVAADAGDGVHRSQDRRQLRGNPAQHGVSRGMPPGVVDLLEPVEVDEEDGGAPTGALRVRKGLVDAIHERAPGSASRSARRAWPAWSAPPARPAGRPSARPGPG